MLPLCQACIPVEAEKERESENNPKENWLRNTQSKPLEGVKLKTIQKYWC